MTRPAVLPVGHDRFAVLALGRRIAAELAAEMLDLKAPLTMADRLALATLSLAVEAEAAGRAGAEPLTAEVIPVLAAALARLERETAPVPIPPALAVGSPRGHHNAVA